MRNGTIAESELRRIWVEAHITCFKILSQHLPGQTDNNHMKQNKTGCHSAKNKIKYLHYIISCYTQETHPHDFLVHYCGKWKTPIYFWICNTKIYLLSQFVIKQN
jgi:hypothetical protein